MEWNLPSLIYLRGFIGHSREACLCGAGPSLNDNLDRVRWFKKLGVPVITTNKVHDHLIDNGIVPDMHVLLDPNEWVADYTTPRKGVIYALASQCHDKTFEKFKGYSVFLWHAAVDTDDGGSEPGDTLANKLYPEIPWISFPGGTTVGMRMPYVANCAYGSTFFHMIGYDSSRSNDKMHAMKKQERFDVETGTITLSNANRSMTKDFLTNEHMAQQAIDFEDFIETHAERVRQKKERPFNFMFYGDGLLPCLAGTYGWNHDPKINEEWGGITPRFLPPGRYKAFKRTLLSTASYH